jgi:hypothetical protein
MTTFEELRAKLTRLQTLQEQVTDQQAHTAIRDLIRETEREISQANAREQARP